MAIKISRKLRLAAEILEGERYGDFAPGFLVGVVKRNRITQKQIYSAVEHFGYRWKNGHWTHRGPRWFETLIKKENEKITALW